MMNENIDIIPIIPHFSQPQPTQEPEMAMNDEDYLKKVYQQVKKITSSGTKYKIIIDNCSLLSTFLGAAIRTKDENIDTDTVQGKR